MATYSERVATVVVFVSAEGDGNLWVEVLVALGEGAWSAGDDLEDFGRLGVKGRPGAAELV